jgi:hypothetical protein
VNSAAASAPCTPGPAGQLAVLAATLSTLQAGSVTDVTSRFRLPPGGWIFVVIFGWLALQLVGLTVWAAVTYPSAAEVRLVAGADSTEALDVLLELRSQWLHEVTTIGTTLAIAPMTALLSAVVGFLLRGVSESRSQQQP